MASQENATASVMPLAGKLARAMAIVLLVGIPVTVLFIVLVWYGAEESCLFGVHAGLHLVSLVGPVLGVCAVVSAARNQRAIAALVGSEQGDRVTRRLALRFLVASLLLVGAASAVAVRTLTLDGGWVVYMVPDWMLIWYAGVALLGVSMGGIALKLLAIAHGRGFWRVSAVGVVLVAVVLVVTAFREMNFVSYLVQRARYARRTETFSGDSSALEDTVIVPTLDTSCPRGKNVIWCSSFQLAWNRLKEDVVGGPVQVTGAEELAGRLNRAKPSAADLEPASFYAAAGWSDQGIIEKIRADMADQFPSHALPDLNDVATPGGIAMYSYLTANVPFDPPFLPSDRGFTFTDSEGRETVVDGFGLWEGDRPEYKKILEQVEILCVWRAEPNAPSSKMMGFAIDLCKHSEPYQVVVARIDLRDTLAQAVEHIGEQMAVFPQGAWYEQERILGSVDELLVPEMCWQIDHRFSELIGATVANAGGPMPIVEARQTIRFRLDRSGAVLESESWGAASAIPRYFLLNEPFLVYMKKRGAEEPFFVMWVDNAELLVSR